MSCILTEGNQPFIEAGLANDVFPNATTDLGNDYSYTHRREWGGA